MTANLIAIAGVPVNPADHVFDLEPGAWGTPRRQGQLPIGDIGPTPEQASALRWLSIGCFSAAAVIAYMLTRRVQAR